MSGQVRFQYGGHATFPVRYGWLPKGVERLELGASFGAASGAADDMGLGSKMVESLAYWLDLLGLTEDRSTARTSNELSALALAIRRNDRFFELPGTWWFLHLCLARREGTVWSWFFNDYPDRVFDRLACTDAFLQYTKAIALRPASPAAAQRDVACLLSAYAARPGVDVVDPDDVGACPLRELGLVLRHDAVNRFERARRPQAVPLEAFLACCSALSDDLGKGALSLRELATSRGGPGRVFCMGMDAIEEMIGHVGSQQWIRDASVETSAGERHLVIGPREPADWLDALYDRVARRDVR
jgi:hypothetical protein